MQQSAGWLHHACICFALMSKSLPNFAWPDFYFLSLKISVTHSETHTVIWESLLDYSWSRMQQVNYRQRGVLVMFQQTLQQNPVVLSIFKEGGGCQIIWMLKFNFYFVQRCARQSLWPSFMDFEWQNSHSVEGGSRHHLNWRNIADCCFLDHHLYLGFYQSQLTFTCSTHIFYFIHKISMWLDCLWCWITGPLFENKMKFLSTASV